MCYSVIRFHKTKTVKTLRFSYLLIKSLPIFRDNKDFSFFKIKNPVILFTALLSLLFPTILFAGTKTWSGATDNNWNTGTNWVGGVAPVAGDDALIPGGLPRLYLYYTPIILFIDINTMENRLQGCTSLPFFRLFTSSIFGKPANNGFGLPHFYISFLKPVITPTYNLTKPFTTSKNQTYVPAEKEYN